MLSGLLIFTGIARCRMAGIRRPSSCRIKRWHSAPSTECRIRIHTVRTMVGVWSYAMLVVLLSTLVVGITAESGHERQKRSPGGYGYQAKKPSSMPSQSLSTSICITLATMSSLAYFTVFTALHGMQTRSSDGNSVCLSVKRVDCDKTEESCI